jgi:hypothetical protein
MNKKIKPILVVVFLVVFGFAIFLADDSDANRQPVPVDVCKVGNQVVECKSKTEDAIEYAHLLKAKNQAYANCLVYKSVKKRKDCNQQVKNVFDPILANFKG